MNKIEDTSENRKLLFNQAIEKIRKLTIFKTNDGKYAVVNENDEPISITSLDVNRIILGLSHRDYWDKYFSNVSKFNNKEKKDFMAKIQTYLKFYFIITAIEKLISTINKALLNWNEAGLKERDIQFLNILRNVSKNGEILQKDLKEELKILELFRSPNDFQNRLNRFKEKNIIKIDIDDDKKYIGERGRPARNIIKLNDEEIEKALGIKLNDFLTYYKYKEENIDMRNTTIILEKNNYIVIEDYIKDISWNTNKSGFGI